MRRMSRLSNRNAIAVVVIVAILISIAIVSVACAATDIYVPDDHRTIRQAVNSAGVGDTVIVRDGTYTENVDVGKRLTIRSENGSASTTVRALNPGDNVFDVTADSVGITGFAVVGSSYAGIYLGGVAHCNISGNIARENGYGFRLHSSCYNRITDNIAKNNINYGFLLFPYSDANVLVSNTANENNCGISLSWSVNNTLIGNTVNDNRWRGIDSPIASDTLIGNIANNNGAEGIAIFSSDSVIRGNTANGNSNGIIVFSCANNTITENAASNNTLFGIYLFNASKNTLARNTARNNTDYGIRVCSSRDNTIYNNRFNNTLNAYDDGTNSWNITKTAGTNIIGGNYLGGNYWSDYTGGDLDSDGIGDTPYNIPGGRNRDYLPLSRLLVSKEMAIRTMIEDILSSTSGPIGAYMPSEPLRQGDVISSESGQEYVINDTTWFIFVNDGPYAIFAHPVWYVFIDAATGTYAVVEETWPPMINNVSMWDAKTLGRGELIEIYSILGAPVPIAGKNQAVPSGDYGDAPDGVEAYYGVDGRFPTLFHTKNSKFGRPGAHTLSPGQEMLGVNVSTEAGATDPDDPDGVSNLVDADSDERMFVIIENRTAKLAFDVTVTASAPDAARYVNVLIDFDQSGNWGGSVNETEWAVANMDVNVSPGTTETVITQNFSWGPDDVAWMRMSLTREQVDGGLFGADGWDGSGAFKFGEIEDFLVFLTDCPPTPDFDPWPPGNKTPPKKPQKPGPEKGPCGYNINYYAIIINGGDHRGSTMMQKGAERMKAVLDEQRYMLIANLGPGANSRAAIKTAFEVLKNNVNCGDHVTIFINGHGLPKKYNKKYPEGGIALKDEKGRTKEYLTPANLSDLLGGIEACPGEACNESRKCCYVAVVIESCFSGNFNTSDVTGQGRIIIGTASDQCSWGRSSTGGHYTYGFDKDLRSKEADLNKDGAVDTGEAHKSAEDKIDKWNEDSKKYRRDYCRRHNRPLSWCADQKPWINASPCNCTCPCAPGISVRKLVWDDENNWWVDEIDAFEGQLVRFGCQVVNSGKCRNVTNITITDFMPYCLKYSNNATIYRNGEEIGPREPDWIEPGEFGSALGWDLWGMGELAPEESIAIRYDATTIYPGENINIVNVSARCTYDQSVIVYDEDAATIVVVLEKPPFTQVDALIALEIAVGSRKHDPDMDANGDGYVTSLDALMILQAAAGAPPIIT